MFNGLIFFVLSRIIEQQKNALKQIKTVRALINGFWKVFNYILHNLITNYKPTGSVETTSCFSIHT